jgi:hypothetical protein
MSDALEILGRGAEDEGNDRDRCRRAMGLLAHELSAGLDVLDGECLMHLTT